MDAEDLPYWKTSKSSPDSWMDKTENLIIKYDGEITAAGFIRQGLTSAYMIRFIINDETFRINWPVMQSRDDNHMAARRQAATMMYHDTKARMLSALVLGMRAAFFNFYELSDGRTAGELAGPELIHALPPLLKGPNK